MTHSRHAGPQRFTLIEVVVALAILSISLAGLLQLSIGSSRKVAEAFNKWEAEHMLAQAAEYVMLHNEEGESVPEEFFPYPGYTAEIVCGDAEGLPEDYSDLEGQLPLKRWNIAIVRTSDGNKTAEVNIDRIDYDAETD
jgi:prepilin-type N-terminal cleavage/methylation domain-containing protein